MDHGRHPSYYLDIPNLLTGQVRYVVRQGLPSISQEKKQFPVLLLPGALDTLEMAFEKQFAMDPALTIVAWDPPGYGLEGKAERIWDEKMFSRDAEVAVYLMQTLGFTKFCVIGWSDGAMTALLMAAKYPEIIQRIVAIAGNAFVDHGDIELYENCRDIDAWDAKSKNPLYEVYGKERAALLWNKWCDTMKYIHEKNSGDVCASVLSSIEAPTLILHGKNDPVVPVRHAEYLAENLVNADLYVIAQAEHDPHISHGDYCNALMASFLTQR